MNTGTASASRGRFGCAILAVWVACGGVVHAAEADAKGYRFAFHPGKVPPGFTKVTPTDLYTPERGYGFDLNSKVEAIDRGADDPIHGGFCTSTEPFFFSVKLPEGNYDVAVTLGDRAAASCTTVRAESRRLMLERVRTAPGEFVTRHFMVNVRTSRIATGGEVRLKTREKGVLHWDDKLTLEFRGWRPCLCAVEIQKVPDAVTVYVAGDSTVTDQPREPWAGWGQMLPRFFKPGQVVIANHAESGESLKSFVAAKRLEKILSTLRKGDYLLIQFGHNDQKDRGPDAGPFQSYTDYLKRFIAAARERGATPVLITPMHRLRFDAAGKVVNSLGDFPEAMRRVAREQNVTLIDLNAASKEFYETLGQERIRKAFVDLTHTNEYGAYEFARSIASAVQNSPLDLARYVVEDVPAQNLKPATFDLDGKTK